MKAKHNKPTLKPFTLAELLRIQDGLSADCDKVELVTESLARVELRPGFSFYVSNIVQNDKP